MSEPVTLQELKAKMDQAPKVVSGYAISAYPIVEINSTLSMRLWNHAAVWSLSKHLRRIA